MIGKFNLDPWKGPRDRKMYVEREVRSTDRIADRGSHEDDLVGLVGLAHEHSGTESDCAM